VFYARGRIRVFESKVTFRPNGKLPDCVSVCQKADGEKIKRR
jgi:hypothetical protein